MYRLILSAALSLCVVSGAPCAANESSGLTALAAVIPADASGLISMVDLDAARGQTRPLVDEHGTKHPELIALSHLQMLAGIRLSDLVMRDGKLEQGMGFSLPALTGLAGWGTIPQQQVVMRLAAGFDAAAIPAALSKRGFEHRAKGDIWHRGEDLQIDIKRVRDDPFSMVGMSSRFAIRGDVLHQARSWAMIEAMVADTPRLMDKGAIAAMLAALPKAGFPGDATQLHILSKKTWATGGLPSFKRVALAEWQDGATLTGALVFVYGNGVAATKAEAELAELIERPVPKDIVQMMLGKTAKEIEAMKDEIANEGGPSFVDRIAEVPVIRTVEAGGSHIVFLGFSRTADLSNGMTLASLRNSPLSRLTTMLMRGELQTTLGLGR